MGITSPGHQNYLPTVVSPGLPIRRDLTARDVLVVRLVVSREDVQMPRRMSWRWVQNVSTRGPGIDAGGRMRDPAYSAGGRILESASMLTRGELEGKKRPVCTMACKQDYRGPCQTAASARGAILSRYVVAWRRPLIPPRNKGRKQGSSEREREMVGKRSM